MRFVANCVCCLAALTTLAACGGGGGGASPTPTPTPPAPAPTISYTLSAPAALGAALAGAALTEYNYSANGFANNGLAGVNAMGAYRRGYWGQGVTVAVADSGVLTTHSELSANIVAGKRSDKDGNLFDDINDADGHGTHVAGIVAAAANNGGMMGVAPRAKIMPLQIGDPGTGRFTGNELSLFRHAANMRAPIVNNSWAVPITTTLFLDGSEDGIETDKINLPAAFLYTVYGSLFSRNLTQIVNIAAADMVFVWAAGNEGWNSETGEICHGGVCRTPQQLIDSSSVAVGGQTLALSAVTGVGANQYAGGYAGAPLVEGGEALAGKWLNVVALQANGLNIASWSNGCGASKHFCVAAPGASIRSASADDKDGNGENDDYETSSGTSMAAPHASGALAVLKSRWQNLPMHVILAIMLHSTDDLGAAGVDDVYGQGKINLSLAAAREGDFNIETGGFFVSAPMTPPTASLDLGSPAPLGAALTGTELAEYEYSANGHANNGLAGINAMGAYRRGYWGQGVTIAVVDSGVLTTHSDLSANIVAGKRADAEGNLHDDVGDPFGHGTHVAGIAAAAANNDGMMGVAPRAKIMPLQIASARDVFDGDELALLRHAATMQTPIVNNSWGDNIDVTLFFGGETYEPPNIDLPAPFVISLQNSSVSAGFAQIKSIAATADMVFVWAAGNSGWNSETGRVLVSLDENDPENLEKRFYATPQQLIASATVVFGGQTLALRNVPNMAEDMPAWGYQNAPLLTGGATLAGKWLNVVALNAMGDAIASFSNGCGASKHFCVAAPGVSIRSAFPTDTDGNGESDDHFVADGSSMAAPHASGALAVLKSRWQQLPMHVILAIMLHSTDDLGAAGVDDVYGQGKINLSLAAAREGGFNIETGEFSITATPFSQNAPPVFPIHSTPPSASPLPANTFALGAPAPLAPAPVGARLAEYERAGGLRHIAADGAQRRGYLGRGVTVAAVDSGVFAGHAELSANLVAGKRADIDGNLHNDINDAFGHGTHVAGIIAAAANGDGMVGVAPQAKIMPLQFGAPNGAHLLGNRNALLRHAATAGVHVVNNSWRAYKQFAVSINGKFYNRVNRVNLPPQALTAHFAETASMYFHPVSAAMAASDAVWVWSAGNEGWNSKTGRVKLGEGEENIYTPQELINSAYIHSNGRVFKYGDFAGAAQNMSSPFYQSLPFYAPALAGKWLNVAALDSTGNKIAAFSNGCGATKYWCVVAPGTDIYSADNSGDKRYTSKSGSSMAAPHASGALAVLKSRWQNLPMNVILAIMLHSTDDLGAAGVDEVYGQGKINLSLAAAREGNFNIETGQFTAPVPNVSIYYDNLEAPSIGVNISVLAQPPQTGNFTETRIELSPLLAGLQPQLAGMSVATRFLGRYYQNINFGGFIAAAPAPVAPINAGRGAAAALLTPAAKAPLLPGLHLAMAGGKPLALHYENDRAFARAELCHACAGDVWQEFSAAAAAPAPAFANSPRRGVAGIKLGNWRLYAAAGADEDGKNAAYTQAGAGWELKRKAYSFHADLYATQENKTFLGGKFAGAAAIGGGSLRGARLQAAATLRAGWRGFAYAEGGIAAARFVSGSGFVGGKPARLAAYKLGASKNNLWHGGDNLRLGLQYHPRIVSGNLQTRFGVATDAVIKDERTQMEFHHQTAMQETTLSLKSARVVSAHIGYSRPLQRGGQLALALQHAMQEGKNQTALALQYQAAF